MLLNKGQGGREMKRIGGILALCVLVGLSISGCMNFQQRAQEAGKRLEEAEHTASSAMAAAGDNRGLIEALEQRIEVLEAEISALRTSIQKQEASQTE